MPRIKQSESLCRQLQHILVLALGLCVCTFVCGCNLKENQEISVLVWKDSVTGLTFTVTVRTLIAKNLTHLVVSGPGEEARKVMLDDDVSLATIRFVKSDGWLLVMNDQYAIGGYELTSGKLVGENHWRELPFTVWKGRGSVVAEAKAGQTDRAGTPANFPIINEP